VKRLPPFASLLFLYKLVLVAWSIYLLIVGTITRQRMRLKYDIDGSCCAGPDCLDDCCCIFWCNCCTVIQMDRHTHDERRYPYDCGSATGLGPNAPQVSVV